MLQITPEDHRYSNLMSSVEIVTGLSYGSTTKKLLLQGRIYDLSFKNCINSVNLHSKTYSMQL